MNLSNAKEDVYFYGKVVGLQHKMEQINMYTNCPFFPYDFTYPIRLYIKDTTTINRYGIELDGEYYVNLKIKTSSLIQNDVKLNDYLLCHILKRHSVEEYKDDACYVCDSTKISNYTKCSIKFLMLIRKLRHKTKCELVFHPSNIDFAKLLSDDNIAFL